MESKNAELVISGLNLLVVLLPFLIAAGVAIARMIWKDKADLRLDAIEKAIGIAYYVTAEISRLTPNKVDDKAAHALKVFRDELARRGVKPTPEIMESAALKLKAIHGAEKTAERLAVAAPARPTLPPTI